MQWIARVLRRKVAERQLEAELSFHMEQQIADYMAAGMSADEARRRVRIEFGGPGQLKEECRDARGTRWLEDMLQDLRFSVRGMRKNPGFTAVAVASLALGIGANTAIYSIVDAVLLKSLPVAHPEQLSILARSDGGSEAVRFSYPAYERYRKSVGDSGQIAAMSSVISFSVTKAGGQAELARGQLVSPEWFDLLGVRPAAGRFPNSTDSQVAVLSSGYWKRRFGGDREIIGSPVTINGNSFHVIGVAPQGFAGVILGEDPDVWMPAVMQHELRYAGNASIDDADGSKPWVSQEGVRWLNLLLRAGNAQERHGAMDRLNAVFHQEMRELASRQSEPQLKNRLLRMTLQTQDGSRGMSPLRRLLATPLWVLMAVVGTILLIACANLANLLLARGRARRKEMAVRLAIGAGRGRLVRQLLTETTLLALIGGAAGLLIAGWGSRALLSMAFNGAVGPRLTAELDYRVLLFAAALSIATGVIFGLAPAVRATRVDAGPELKSQARTGGTADYASSRYWLGKTLVAVQVAFSLVLLVAAVLFVRTLQNLASVNPGFERESVLTARIELRAIGYREQDLPALYQRVLEHVRAMPAVRSASLSLYSLASGSARTSAIFVPGRGYLRGEDQDSQENYVGTDYFGTVGLLLVKGRDFTPQDRIDSPKVAIVNETFARRFFPDADCIGRRFSYDADDTNSYQIIGIARDARVNDLKQTIPAMAYYPLSQHPTEYIRSVDVRASGDPRLAGASVRSAIAEVDRNIPVREVITLAEQVDRTLTAERLVARLTSLFGALAIVLACIGLFGVMSYTVARRRGELAIRMALGSSQRRVVWLVLGETLAVVGAGVISGLAISFALLRVVSKLLYGLSATDPLSLSASAVLLLIVGAMAGWIPAWRASRVDPMKALRYE